jgi:hypothetical protein
VLNDLDYSNRTDFPQRSARVFSSSRKRGAATDLTDLHG